MQPEFSRLVSIEHIDSIGKTHEIIANKEECLALAKRFSLESILHLSASINLQRVSKGRIRATGSFTAQIVQSSSISLDSFSSTICDTFTTLFIEGEEEGGEIDLDKDNEDIEFIQQGSIDIGELTSEYLSLSIPLFPRKEGESFYYKSKEEDIEKTEKNSFSVLKKIK